MRKTDVIVVEVIASLQRATIIASSSVIVLPVDFCNLFFGEVGGSWKFLLGVLMLKRRSISTRRLSSAVVRFKVGFDETLRVKIIGVSELGTIAGIPTSEVPSFRGFGCRSLVMKII